MPECPDIFELLHFFEGKAAPEDCARLAAHLQSCPACREQLEALAEVNLLADEGALPEPSDAETANVRATLRHVLEDKPLWRSLFQRFSNLRPKDEGFFSAEPCPAIASTGVTAAEGKRLAANACAILAELEILRRYGVSVSIDQATSVSAHHNWYNPDKGTWLNCVGNLLKHHGLSVRIVEQATLDDIEELLAAGCSVIAIYDAGELLGDSLLERIRETVEDWTRLWPDHASIVESVVRNEATIDSVFLYDPTLQQQPFRVPVGAFHDAWQDSNHRIIVIDPMKARA